MKKSLLKKSFILITIIIAIIVLFFVFFVRYEVDSIESQVKENKNNIEVILNYSESLNKCYSYSISSESGIFSIKIKTAPFFGSDWPKKILINENPEKIKAIEITDGSKSKVIYP